MVSITRAKLSPWLPGDLILSKAAGFVVINIERIAYPLFRRDTKSIWYLFDEVRE